MARTISNTYTSGVTLTNIGDNPVTLTSAAQITDLSPGYAALYGVGGAGQAWTITNAGVINGGNATNGIQLGNYSHNTATATAVVRGSPLGRVRSDRHRGAEQSRLD